MSRLMGACLLAAAGLSGCAVPGPGPAPAPAAAAASAAPLPRYRCDEGIEFTVRFMDDSAVLNAGARGSEVLLRDAGGLTPEQTVYSNSHLRAEFGLGSAGRQAVLRYLSSGLVASCTRD